MTARTAPAVALETARCPVCGEEGRELYAQRDYWHGGVGEFGQRGCGGCGGYFLSPRPVEGCAGRYYPETYAPYQPPAPNWLDRAGERLGLGQYRRRLVERFVAGGRILDAGCGNGEFLARMDTGWERYAIDVRPRVEFGFPVRYAAGRVDGEMPELPPMDAITLWHVFEHVYHPDRGLARLRDLLAPGGHLFLAVPDPDCLERRLFGRYWIGWDPPRHTATYSRRGMEALLRRNGLRLVDVRADHCTGTMWAMNFDAARGTRWRERAAARALFTPVAWATAAVGLAPAKVYVVTR